jgi:(1->4)-alpha-D-glucan 1-alpha-D-glucosylmutase
MNTLLRVEMRSLGRQLASLATNDRYAKNLLRPELMDVLLETTACFPVYRTYIRNLDVPESAKHFVGQALDEARRRRPRLSRACFDFLWDVLTLANPPHILADQREERLAFVMRWQQFTGPIVAKGIEDTALYVYYPLLSLNEVGGSPEPSKLMTWEHFCEFIRDRQKYWPETLNAGSTHDTKRSEDVRARINVLSEIPNDWAKALAHWAKVNEPHKQTLNDSKVPDANEEYLIYQTLVGLWPADLAELPSISERLQDYAVKATREASVHTQWTEPNAAHEHAICSFIGHVLSPENNADFLGSVARFMEKVSYAAMSNGLGQTLLKIACPGVPDFYQGTELWDFHLVDPDNRGAVNFGQRTQALQEIMNRDKGGSLQVAKELAAHWTDGCIKLYLIWKALSCRRQHPSLFTDGEFVPLRCTGPRSQHVISFLRRQGKDQALVLVPRWVSGSWNSDDRGNNSQWDGARDRDFWKGTNLHLPQPSPAAWRNVFTGEVVSGAPGGDAQSIPVSELLQNFPVVLMTSTGESPT